MDYFIAIDFDGTVTEVDITDAVISEFAGPEWKISEDLWECGLIGSQECLETQMSLINAPIETLLAYIEQFSINDSFTDFAAFLNGQRIPFAIISDGFRPFIERLLNKAGLNGIPVYANNLFKKDGATATAFPYAIPDCPSATCKCMVSERLCDSRPVILVGDGRSDFCIAEKAAFVFSRGRLTEYCVDRGIPHQPFSGFREVGEGIKNMIVGLQPEHHGLFQKVHN